MRIANIIVLFLTILFSACSCDAPQEEKKGYYPSSEALDAVLDGKTLWKVEDHYVPELQSRVYMAHFDAISPGGGYMSVACIPPLKAGKDGEFFTVLKGPRPFDKKVSNIKVTMGTSPRSYYRVEHEGLTVVSKRFFLRTEEAKHFTEYGGDLEVEIGDTTLRFDGNGVFKGTLAMLQNCHA